MPLASHLQIVCNSSASHLQIICVSSADHLRIIYRCYIYFFRQKYISHTSILMQDNIRVGQHSCTMVLAQDSIRHSSRSQQQNNSDSSVKILVQHQSFEQCPHSGTKSLIHTNTIVDECYPTLKYWYVKCIFI